MELNTRDILKIPNLLSILRILMFVPFILLLKNHQNNWFLVLAFIAIISDWLDGFLARKFNQITELGKVLDPIADKLNTAGIILALSIYQGLPSWIAIIVIGRDLFILIGALFIFRQKRYVTPSNLLGKFTMFFIAITIILFIAKQQTLFDYALYITLILVIVSFLFYLRVFIQNYIGTVSDEKRS